jgi:DNA-binding MarR family transcriptional regulator
MSIAMELENLALGEVTLEEGSKTVRAVLERLDQPSAVSLYEALRSWTWKALEARRRDDELSGWMDIMARTSSHIDSVAAHLAVKIEVFIELLQASVMTAAAASERDPLERKHVRAALATVYKHDGRLRRRELMEQLGLKAPNLSRVMTALQDDGFIMREVDGREIFYRLTIKGRAAAASIMAHEGIVFEVMDKSVDRLAKIVNIVTIGHGKQHQQNVKQAFDDPFQRFQFAKPKYIETTLISGNWPDASGPFESYDLSMMRAERLQA